MKKLILSIVAMMLLSVSVHASLGFLKNEKVSGMNKICYYDVLGSIYTLNIKSYELCPLSYDF
ncbi:MAG: hypothetical protein OEL19_10770 [Sulfurimonas sp.]|nr:hypothetical protein [Sulfurimonas sp.]